MPDKNTGRCGAQFTDGDESLTCERDGRHLIHRDANGTSFKRVGKGALIADPKPNK